MLTAVFQGHDLNHRGDAASLAVGHLLNGLFHGRLYPKAENRCLSASARHDASLPFMYCICVAHFAVPPMAMQGHLSPRLLAGEA
jgi:hypothetical protein